jgi:hypothetical protein
MTDVKKQNDATRVTTGKVRLSYVNLLQPRTNEDGENPKYSCVLLIPKTDKATVKAIKAAIEAAKEKDKGRWNGKIPSNLKITFRDGDEEDAEDRPELVGHYFMNVSAKNKPGIVDRNVNPITDADEIYSGMYARAAIRAFGYNTNGNKGITFGLDHIQKIADGDFLGGRTRAEDVFDSFEDEDDDSDDIL